MATKAGYLTIGLKGSSANIVSAGLKVAQPIDADMIAGDGILFSVDGTDHNWFYDSTTDTVFLTTADGFSVPLTRKGDFWQWIIGPNDLGSPATIPGSSVNKTCQIVVERLTGGAGTAVTRMVSEDFTLTIERQYGFTPQSISGLIAHFDAYDITDAVAASVASWNDRTLFNRDLAEATNRPTRQNTGAGRPFVLFDGTNDILTDSLADAGLACTVLAVFKCVAQDATLRGVIQVGGTNGARIAFNNANLKGASGADVANTSLPAVGAFCVAVATKTASGAITIQKGTAAAVSQASVNAVTPGTVTVGDTAVDSFANIGVHEIMVWDNVLSAANINRAVRAMQQKWQATG